jgi:hypothetical protein
MVGRCWRPAADAGSAEIPPAPCCDDASGELVCWI